MRMFWHNYETKSTLRCKCTTFDATNEAVDADAVTFDAAVQPALVDHMMSRKS
eukprot:m.103781 g.103781  ORF g.103781 m.103781 type:complete len:53 (+) comp15231_c0_seq8:2585-2743(+)